MEQREHRALILYGAGLIAAESCHYLERRGHGGDIVCFAVTATPSAETFCGRPLLSAEEAFQRYPETDVLVTLQEKYHAEVAAFLQAHGRQAVGWWGLQHATALLREEGVERIAKLPGILAEADPEDYSMMRIACASAPERSFRLYPMTQVPLSEAEERMLPKVMIEEFPDDFGAYPAPICRIENSSGTMKQPSIFIAMACSTKDATIQRKMFSKEIHPVLGGAVLDTVRPPGMFYDDTGRNISKDNRLFSELSVTYWLHENAPAVDYLGLFHYRRHLVLTEELRAAMADHCVDVILPRPRLTFPNVETLFLRPTMGTLARRDYEQMFEILSEQYPSVAGCARRIFRRHIHFPANILIARADVFHDYASFLFSVLQTIQRQNKENSIHQESRSFGYLGELLTTLYFAYHHEEFRMQYADCHLIS